MEMTAAPTHTMMKTISNRRVLSSALVPELNTLLKLVNKKTRTYTANIRQKIKGPQRSPMVIVKWPEWTYSS